MIKIKQLSAGDFSHQKQSKSALTPESKDSLTGRLTLSTYVALSALMEQKARLYQAQGSEEKIAQAQQFPIKVISYEEQANSSQEEVNNIKKANEIPTYAVEDFLDLQKISQQHTLDTYEYLKYRLPKTIVELAKTLHTTIWIGSEDDMPIYLREQKITLDDKIYAANMCRFFLAHNADGSPFLWVSGTRSISHLKHLLLQLSYANIRSEAINILGDFKENKSQAIQRLKTYLAPLVLPDVDKILFIGSKTTTMKALNPLSHKTVSHNVANRFNFNELYIENNEGKKVQVFVLKIPNGDAAYDATQAFLDLGIRKVVMTGAGGAISEVRNIGDYQPINETVYMNEKIHLNKDSIIELGDASYLAKNHASHITVDSPLDETSDWYNQNKNYGCVDVETYHIFKALNEVADVKVIPGLFISDVVNKIPFSQQLTGSSVGKHIGEFSLVAFQKFANTKSENNLNQEIPTRRLSIQ